MRFLRSRRGWIVLAALLLALFLFRPGVHRLRNRTARAIGSALGRRVALDNVRVHLLPRPGFDLEGLVIYDDPSFSAEPMMRAGEVSAPIRFSSLLRGRLEFATLSATEPSINLVRNSDGRWNLASLLQRAASVSIAPTGKRVSERRPAFPYLEATRARINFKIGQEKKSYALSDGTLALWQESENSWGARLVAAPVRTDFNLTDTGRVSVNATWQRAPQLDAAPLLITVQWDQGQLGQITKLFSGRDRGWRGSVALSANLSGTPQALLIRSQMKVDDFRRYDIVGGDSVRLATECSGQYSADAATLTDIFCEAPVSDGAVRLRGSIGPLTRAAEYDLTFAAEKVPLLSVLRLARQVKKDLPSDLVASGRLNLELRAWRHGAMPVELSGEGSATEARFVSNGGKDQVSFPDIPLEVVGGNAGKVKPAIQNVRRHETRNETAESYLKIGPFPIQAGATNATADGALSLSGYRFTLRGDTSLKNIFRIADTLGLPGSRPPAQGPARVDLSLAGTWQGFAAPLVTGTAQLHNVRAEMRGLNTPLEISGATAVLASNSLSLQKIAAQTGATHWTGTVTAPRGCTMDCQYQLDLAADQLSTADLDQWFMPHAAKRPWYRLLSSSERDAKSPLLTLHATGVVRVGRLKIRKLIASQVVTQLDLASGKINLTALRGQMLEGTHRGNWVVDLSGRTPQYQGTGTLQGISLVQLTAIVNDGWATGTADGKYDLTSSGASVPDILSHVEGGVQFAMQNGSLPHIDLAGAAKPFPVHRFTGELKLKKGSWELRTGKLESRDGIYQVSGTASPGAGMDLALVRGDEQKWNLSGTLAKPHIVAVDRTEAKTALKP